MASITIHTSGKFPSFNLSNKSAQFSCSQRLPPNKIARLPPSASIAIIPANHQPTELASGSDVKKSDPRGKIESWVHDSVEDIVKNLKHAPLLVQIYSEIDGGVKIRTEKAVVDEWAEARGEWRSGESKSPDGLIFVEELERESGAWGVLVQGKGVECGPACYLLKTDRVCAGLGLGFCTHFCLMRVNNFVDSALHQFQDSWLLQ